MSEYWLITTYSHDRGTNHENPYVTKTIGCHPLDYLKNHKVWADTRLISAVKISEEDFERYGAL